MSTLLSTARLSIACLALLPLCQACATPPQPAPSEEIMADQTPAEDHVLSARGSNQFTLDLYRALASSEGNLFLSPFGIRVALAMAMGGARGETAAEMSRVLHHGGADADHAALGALLRALAAEPGSEGGDSLLFANRLWGADDAQFREEFLAQLATDYSAGLEQTDFRRQASKAVAAINAWCNEATRGMIPELVTEDLITPSTILVLTNAVYFLGSWESPFNPEATSDQPFHSSTGEAATVPMMRRKGRYGYNEGENFQVLVMPYAGGELSMVAVLPAEGTPLKDVEVMLNSESLHEWTADLPSIEVDVHFPRFRSEASFQLGKVLVAMGMERAFNNADFSGMAEGETIALSEVVHKAVVDVSEKGTEASAATAVIATRATALARPTPTFKADRPFLYFIRHEASGAVLFIGRLEKVG